MSPNCEPKNEAKTLDCALIIVVINLLILHSVPNLSTNENLTPLMASQSFDGGLEDNSSQNGTENQTTYGQMEPPDNKNHGDPVFNFQEIKKYFSSRIDKFQQNLIGFFDKPIIESENIRKSTYTTTGRNSNTVVNADAAYNTYGDASTSSSDYSSGLELSGGSSSGFAEYRNVPTGAQSGLGKCMIATLTVYYNTADAESTSSRPRLSVYPHGSSTRIADVYLPQSDSSTTYYIDTGKSPSSSGKLKLHMGVQSSSNWDGNYFVGNFYKKTSTPNTPSMNAISNANIYTKNQNASFSVIPQDPCPVSYYLGLISMSPNPPSKSSNAWSNQTPAVFTGAPPSCGDVWGHGYTIDAVGRETSIVSKRILRHDSCEPALSVENPSSGWLESAPSINISSLSDDHSGLGSHPLQILINNLSVGFIQSTTVINGSYLDPYIVCGSNSVQIIAYDVLGNTKSKNVSFLIDNCEPSFNDNLSFSPYYLNESAITLTWNGCLDNETGVEGYILSWNNSNISLSANTTSYSISNLKTGDYFYSVTCIDFAGNANTSEVKVLKIDRTQPSIDFEILSHSEGVWSKNKTVRFNLSAEDQHSGTYRVRAAIIHGNVSMTTAASFATAGVICNGNCTASDVISIPGASISGHYSLCLMVEDRARDLSHSLNPNTQIICEDGIAVDNKAPIYGAPLLGNIGGFWNTSAIVVQLPGNIVENGVGFASFSVFLEVNGNSFYHSNANVNATLQIASSLNHSDLVRICVTGSDNLSNIGSKTCSNTIVVEAIASGLIVHGGHGGWSNTSSPNVNISMCALSGVQSAQLLVLDSSGITSSMNLTTFAVCAGTPIQLSSLTDGEVVINLEFVTNVGNVFETTLQIKVDTSAPGIQINATQDWISTRWVVLDVNGSDIGIGNNSIRVYFDGNLIFTQNYDGNQFNDSVMLNSSYIVGNITVEVKICDDLNNCRFSDRIIVRIDPIPPTCSIVGPMDYWLAEDPTFRLVITSNNPSPVQTLLSWENQDVLKDQVSNFIGVYRMYGANSGDHYVNATVESGSGLTGTCNHIFKVDHELPYVELEKVPELIGQRNFEIRLSANDSVSGIALVEVFLGSISVCEAEYESHFNISYMCNVEFSSDGHHLISIEIQDTAGNIFKKNYTITVDTTPPSLRVTTDDPGQVYGLEGFWFMWNTDDLTNVSTRVIIGENEVLNSTWPEGSYLLNLESGNYTVRIISTDQAGNVESVEIHVQFWVDRTMPEITCDIENNSRLQMTATRLNCEVYDDSDLVQNGFIASINEIPIDIVIDDMKFMIEIHSAGENHISIQLCDVNLNCVNYTMNIVLLGESFDAFLSHVPTPGIDRTILLLIRGGIPESTSIKSINGIDYDFTTFEDGILGIHGISQIAPGPYRLEILVADALSEATLTVEFDATCSDNFRWNVSSHTCVVDVSDVNFEENSQNFDKAVCEDSPQYNFHTTIEFGGVAVVYSADFEGYEVKSGYSSIIGSTILFENTSLSDLKIQVIEEGTEIVCNTVVIVLDQPDEGQDYPVDESSEIGESVNDNAGIFETIAIVYTGSFLLLADVFRRKFRRKSDDGGEEE